MTLTPKNWSEFQHYKDRKPAWIKLHRTILDNYEFARLPVASRALAPLLWLLASEYDEGEITCNEEALAFRLRMPLKDLRVALIPLIERGFFISDSGPLADRKQDASLEKERETQVKTEKNLVDLEFEKFKRAYPKRKGSQGWPTAHKHFIVAIRAGHQANDLIASAQRFSASLPSDQDPKFIPMAETWMRKQAFKEFLPTPEDAARSAGSDEFMRAKGFTWDGEKWTKIEAAE